MIKLNKYITEAWSGVKQQSLKSDIEAWCDEMGIKNYTINSKGEIDVDGGVILNFFKEEELPYKFRTVSQGFYMSNCDKLKSLKNCPSIIYGDFKINKNKNLDSLEGCPTKVDGEFYCTNNKRKFSESEIRKLCKVKYITIE